MENQDEKRSNPPKDGGYTIIGPTNFEELSTYTYTVMPSNATGYYWQVSGGNLMSGQGTDVASIQWIGTSGVITVGVITSVTVLDTNVGGGKHDN